MHKDIKKQDPKSPSFDGLVHNRIKCAHLRETQMLQLEMTRLLNLQIRNFVGSILWHFPFDKIMINYF